jgi:site-specific DNA-methyltransferase (adenine-specific)
VSYLIQVGDAREWIAKLRAESIDALVCDPPAGISFMGREWDHDYGHRDNWIKAFAEVFALALKTMKPGAHGLVWALPRTSHWTATALEDAGFEIRDIVMHLFGTGFPKSLDVSKAIKNSYDEMTAAADPDTGFEGWGTALKPAAEHWILVRKPLIGTVAANVLAHGTGGLNIDGCRIGFTVETWPSSRGGNTRRSMAGGEMLDPNTGAAPAGRWPAHLTLDEEAAAMLDAQSGYLKDGTTGVKAGGFGKKGASSGVTYGGTGYEHEASTYGGSGGASRFFYVAKASRSEREAGLDDLPAKTGGEATGRVDGTDGLKSPRAGAGRTGGARNHHPTVKSVALMRWLIRLVTPPGGIVLDPFMGSGSTGVAALAEGMKFIGIEKEAEYVEIARRRIAAAAPAAPSEEP